MLSDAGLKLYRHTSNISWRRNMLDPSSVLYHVCPVYNHFLRVHVVSVEQIMGAMRLVVGNVGRGEGQQQNPRQETASPCVLRAGRPISGCGDRTTTTTAATTIPQGR